MEIAILLLSSVLVCIGAYSLLYSRSYFIKRVIFIFGCLSVFLLGLSKGGHFGTDIPRYVIWLESIKDLDLSSAIYFSRFEYGFVITSYFLSHFISSDYLIYNLCSLIFIFIISFSYVIFRSLKLSITSSYFSAFQLLFWFFAIDLSFNVIRSGISSCFLLIFIYFLINKNYFTSFLMAMLSAMFHVTVVPIIVMMYLSIGFPKFWIWASLWITVFLIKIFGIVDYSLSSIEKIIPLAKHQMSFLNSEKDLSLNLLLLSLIVFLMLFFLRFFQKKLIYFDKLSCLFFGSNIVFIFFSSMPFSYRIAYYSLLLLPASLAVALDLLPRGTRAIAGLITFIIVYVLNMYAFGFVKEFWTL